MIRYLADYIEFAGPLRLFDSITFRAVLGVLAAFGLTLLFGDAFIAWMRGRKATEDVNKPDSETLHRLHADKSGTPTMGGLMILAALAVTLLVCCDPAGTRLLRMGDLRDPRATLTALSQPDTSPHPRATERILSRMEAEDRRWVQTRAVQAAPLSPEEVSRLHDALNAVLGAPALYDAGAFDGVDVPDAVSAALSGEHAVLLHRKAIAMKRRLLSQVFPGQIAPPAVVNPLVVIGFVLVLAFGALGFVDDYMKMKGRGKQGLTKTQKLAAQTLLAAAAAVAVGHYADPAYTTRVLVPFTKWAHFQPDLGWGYYVFFVFVIVACSNAVNLTDGLDGLAGGCTIMVAVTYGLLAYVVGNARMCAYFRIPYVPESAELTIYCMALAGAVMGFLWFNAHPARVFMGDTGSLALGAALAYVALVIKHELVLVLAGGIFVVEAGSVLLQVISFRWCKRRIFKCAPYHHHLQFCGWHENHVVVRIWIIGALLAAAALGTLKLH